MQLEGGNTNVADKESQLHTLILCFQTINQELFSRIKLLFAFNFFAIHP